MRWLKFKPASSPMKRRPTDMTKAVRNKKDVADSGQGVDAFFRGTAGSDVSLKDQRSVIGTPNAALPAFVLGEELADIADQESIQECATQSFFCFSDSFCFCHLQRAGVGAVRRARTRVARHR